MLGRGQFHFHASTRTLYQIEKCETCGDIVQAPNAVQLCSDPALVRPALIYDETLPAEQFHNDATGLCACEGCGL